MFSFPSFYVLNYLSRKIGILRPTKSSGENAYRYIRDHCKNGLTLNPALVQ